MATRKRVKRSKDLKVFRRTAMATRRANVMPEVMRGGIRL